MARFTNRVFALVFISSIFGCSQQGGVPQQDHVYRTITTTSKDPTLLNKPVFRSGPAYVQSGFRHVLAERRVTRPQEDSTDDTFPISPAQSIHAAKTISVISFSIYEMQSWERFCGSDRINSKDWEFISSVGRHNIPELLQDNCIPPDYTHQDYLSAWEKSCSNTSLTTTDRLIQSKTISPEVSCEQ